MPAECRGLAGARRPASLDQVQPHGGVPVRRRALEMIEDVAREPAAPGGRLHEVHRGTAHRLQYPADSHSQQPSEIVHRCQTKSPVRPERRSAVA